MSNPTYLSNGDKNMIRKWYYKNGISKERIRKTFKLSWYRINKILEDKNEDNKS